MCTSKCGGACISLLKNKLLDSKQSLIELKNLLNNLTECGTPAGRGKNNFMKKVNSLKMEAATLLDEADSKAGSLEPRTIHSFDHIESIFEELSFKERLNELKQKIDGLSRRAIILK